MTTPVSIDDVLASLSALERGDGSLAGLEAALERALPPGAALPDEARTRIRSAGQAGLVPNATLLRFGIVATEPTPHAAPSTPVAGVTVLRPSPTRTATAEPPTRCRRYGPWHAKSSM